MLLSALFPVSEGQAGPPEVIWRWRTIASGWRPYMARKPYLVGNQALRDRTLAPCRARIAFRGVRCIGGQRHDKLCCKPTLKPIEGDSLQASTPAFTARHRPSPPMRAVRNKALTWTNSPSAARALWHPLSKSA
jgi:hypothetical protein